MIALFFLLLLVTNPQEPTSSEQAAELFESYYEEYLALFPRAATEVGDHRYDHLFENDISEENREAERDLYAAYLKRSELLDRDALAPDERMSLDVLRFVLTGYLEGLAYPDHLMPITQMVCTPADFADMGAGETLHPFETVQDYDNFLGRMDGFVVWVETAIPNMSEGMERGITLPELIARKTIDRIRGFELDTAETSVFWKPIENLPQGFSDEDRARLEAAYRTKLDDEVLPAYAGLLLFMEEVYLPACRDTLAWTALPDGRAWYEFHLRNFTTTDLTPDEVHELGLQECERIWKELAAARKRQAAAGPRSKYSSAEELSAAYFAIYERVEPHVETLFTRFPKTRLEIKQSDWGSYYEPGSDDATRAGVFRFEAPPDNGLAANPQGTSEALFAHEAIPGHHYQISLQRESSLPRFRKGGFFSAYMEGWGLYAESLGATLGLYQDPHQEVSRLNSEMFRAMRLVFDTGFHAKGWSLEDAFRWASQYGYGEGIRWELERYVAWPGQAVTYKVGELRILELRARARAALGDEFDIRAFHDIVLSTGAVPLDLLEQRVEEWMR
jgi:uncharacterized protein (DUF885 family)